MNAKNVNEYKPLLEALAAGKTIQYWDEYSWVDIADEIGFTFGPEEYRIKPEQEMDSATVDLVNRFYELIESHAKLKADHEEMRELFYDNYCTALERVASLERTITDIKANNDEVSKDICLHLAGLHI
jgi:hypothetical protein